MTRLEVLGRQAEDLFNEINREIRLNLNENTDANSLPLCYGFSAATILELRREYLKRGGRSWSPTPGDIREVFQDKHEHLPVQPVYIDASGIKRFEGNAIVEWLFQGNNILDVLDNSFSEEDLLQFVMLTGHSLCYLREISWVSKDVKDKILKEND